MTNDKSRAFASGHPSIVHEMQLILDGWEIAENVVDAIDMLKDYVTPQIDDED